MVNATPANHTGVVPDVCDGDDAWEDLVHYNRRVLFVALGGPIILIYLYTSKIATTLTMPLETRLKSESGAGICNRFLWFLVWGICSTPEAIMFSVLVAAWVSEMPCLFESCSAIECPGYQKSAIAFLSVLFGTWVLYYVVRMFADSRGSHTYGLFKFDWDKYNSWVLREMEKKDMPQMRRRSLRGGVSQENERAKMMTDDSDGRFADAATTGATPMSIPALIMKVGCRSGTA